ncbi:MAG: antitoxin VapB family protein [Methanoregulaceae archaeon]
MATKTISITEEAYDRLRALKKDEKMSFSDVIVAYYPVKRKLSDVLDEIGDCTELADSVETVSREMRKAKIHEVSDAGCRYLVHHRSDKTGAGRNQDLRAI